MSNIAGIFENFYSNYNRKSITEKYFFLTPPYLIAEFYTKFPFDVDVRFKNGIFAMQINSESVISMELMTIIGYYFDNYSSKKNCVWTKNEKYIYRFFNGGISNFLCFGGKITINISDEEKRVLTEKLANTLKKTDEKLKEKLYENFNLLETMDFESLVRKIESELEEEKKKKHVEKVTSMDLPLDWENVFSKDAAATDVHADSISDGLVLSLNNLGRVDIEYISQITGEDCKTVISALKGAIYQNPDTWDECFYKGWETADDYLSGNVAEKCKKVKKANEKYCGYFAENVKALKKVLPEGVSADGIYITLGSPWVPTDIIDDFIEHLLGTLCFITSDNRKYYTVKHDEITGEWKIPLKSRYNGTIKSRHIYGTERIEALYIIEKTLNLKGVVIKDEKVCHTNKSGKKRVINKEETLAATQKQKDIIKEFQSWVWSCPQRKERLETIFSEKFGSSIVRKFDGSFLSFPHMADDAKLYDYQKNAVARIMFTPNTLLAHDVGSGKTYIMAAAGMELKRIGLSNKNLYVVPNNIIGQWKDIFQRLYPEAKIFCIEPKMFKKEKREEILGKIRDEDFDAIIMAYSTFEMIPPSKESYAESIRVKIESINKIAKSKDKVTEQGSYKKGNMDSIISDLEESMLDVYDTVYFDQLGITRLFIDEAHNFKNLPIETKIQNVLGISKTGSQKCRDMLEKVRIVQKQNEGRGVVMATGTPITNSITDIFVMQTYLQSGELALVDLKNFDSWVGMFAEPSMEFEIDVDTTAYRMTTRLSKFHNLPELSRLIASIADFHRADESNNLPRFDGYTDSVIPRTEKFKNYLEEISRRASDVRNRLVKPKEDNMLKITTDGRKAALDLRLVKPKAGFTTQSKVYHCAENVFEIYMENMLKRSTQLVFCDTSTPKKDFNVYDELKRLLVNMGISESHIAYVHDADSESKRAELFENVRNGEIRVLIGSTAKLGMGVNVQDRLIAIHHLDVPWRPADMVQREGRIIRQGNTNEAVDVYRYITEGSFDAYSWQLLETKQKMITDILSGCVSVRDCNDVDDTVLDYAEVKALAIGNPLIKERVEKTNELQRCITLQRQLLETRQNLENELFAIPAKIEHQKEMIENCIKDIEYFEGCKKEYLPDERKEVRELIYNAIEENELSGTETKVLTYQGFDILIPSNITKQKAFVYVKNFGKYAVEMGTAKSGMLVRIDNFLENFEGHLERLEVGLEKLKKRRIEIDEELAKKEGYTEIITVLKKELANIDKKLGVDKVE